MSTEETFIMFVKVLDGVIKEIREVNEKLKDLNTKVDNIKAGAPVVVPGSPPPPPPPPPPIGTGGIKEPPKKKETPKATPTTPGMGNVLEQLRRGGFNLSTKPPYEITLDDVIVYSLDSRDNYPRDIDVIVDDHNDQAIINCKKEKVDTVEWKPSYEEVKGASNSVRLIYPPLIIWQKKILKNGQEINERLREIQHPNNGHIIPRTLK